ncbi:MAG: hypothetical protein R2940_06740 [Syntrophotaleaceae bacterium]
MDLSVKQAIAACDFGEALIYPGSGPSPQISLLVRERSAMIRYFGETTVDLRAGFYPLDNCGVVTVLLRVGRHARQTYATWWDYWAPGGKESFQQMKRQNLLPVFFHGNDARRERTFVLENPLITFFSNVMTGMCRWNPWTPEVFMQSCREILSNAGSVEGLWEELADRLVD